tara:strand:- start:525 stop:785 length:261 start_codon:yes stop_codon:yes gene_type:complete
MGLKSYSYRIIDEVTKLIAGAAVFVSALIWRDVIQDYIKKRFGIKGSAYYALCISILAVVFVIGMNILIEYIKPDKDKEENELKDN